MNIRLKKPGNLCVKLDVEKDDGPVEILQKRDQIVELLDRQVEMLIDQRPPAQMEETILELTKVPVPNAYLRRALEIVFRGSDAARDVMFKVRHMIDMGELGIAMDWQIVRKGWKGKEETKR